MKLTLGLVVSFVGLVVLMAGQKRFTDLAFLLVISGVVYDLTVLLRKEQMKEAKVEEKTD